MLCGDSTEKEKAYLHTLGASHIDLGVSACHSGKIVERVVSCAAHLPRSKFLSLFPSIIRIVGGTTNALERHAMIHYVVRLVFEKKDSDCKRRGSVQPDGMNRDRALEHCTEWGLRDMLDHLFQQTPWLHKNAHSLNMRAANDESDETIQYFREELILTFLLCWYERNHVEIRSEKRIPPQSLDDALELLIFFPTCLMYLASAESLSVGSDKYRHPLANVYARQWSRMCIWM